MFHDVLILYNVKFIGNALFAVSDEMTGCENFFIVIS